MPSDSGSVAPELQALLDASPDAVLVVDRAGTVVALNRRTETLFGTTADQLRGKPVEVLVPARVRESHAVVRAAYGRAPTVRAMSARDGLMGLRTDGTEFPVEVALTPVVGSAAGLVMAVVHDVTARVGIEQALGRSDRTGGALDAISDGLLTTDPSGNVDFLNHAAEQLTGMSRAAAHGRPLLEVLPLVSDAGEPLDSPVADCLRTGTPTARSEARLAGPSGDEGRVLDISTVAIRDGAGRITGAAVVVRDVTQARLIARQLSHQATHDALTGLVNRSEFERRLARATASASEEQAEHALCFLDLDGFKRVNDVCGHLAGDEMLRQLSDLMRDRMRSRDTLARLGGDEFGMLLEHCRLPTAARIAEGIREAIAAHRFVFDGDTFAVGASIGIVPIRAGRGAAADLLLAADNACYLAKARGGNRVQLFDQRERRPALGPHDWVRRILGAIEENRFQLHAQMLVPLEGADGRAPRLELLLRLYEGGGEPVLPGTFLPAASRYGLLPAIDRWVVQQVVQRLSAWHGAHPGIGLPTVAINLGDQSVSDIEVAGMVRDLLAASAIRPDALCFEIGESGVTARPASSLRLLRDLRETGCQLTLEHCGSGMAAFTLLRRLPVDYLKIAGHVVRGLARDPVDRALAGALNQVGHALHLGTIGVEVETTEVLACLRRLGVDYAQGYALGRPEPLDAAIERLVAAPAGTPRPL